MDQRTVETALRIWVALSLVVGLGCIFVGHPILGGLGVTLLILGLMSIMFVVGLRFEEPEEVVG